MSGQEDIIGKLQGGLVAILMGYFLLKFLDAFPTDIVGSDPFGFSYLLISLMPWFLVGVGIAILASMFAEVFNP
jgi:hypothetical protein